VSPFRPDLVACWLFRLDAAGRPEILLIHRAPGRIYEGLWQCVTGRLEAGERVVDGALREVAEETGLDRADLEAVFETDIVNWFHEGSADAVWCEAVFAAQVREGSEVRLSDEHDDFRWLSAEGARELVIWPAYERAIDQVEWLVDHPAKAAHYRLVDSAP
jgi:dATP pyrophosphohydrolase